jgi:hypothetical protein
MWAQGSRLGFRGRAAACRSLAHEREELARAEAMAAAAAAEAAAQEDEVRCCCVRAWLGSVIMQERG